MTAALDILTLGILASSFTGNDIRVSDPVSCPFIAPECHCFNSSDPTIDFDRIECTSATGGLLNLTLPEGANHTIHDALVVNSLSIAGNVADLPANYFGSFRHVHLLQLNNSAVKRQNWNQYAFGGCHVNQLELNGLDDMLPPPTALTRAQELQELSIINGQQPIKLLGYQFLEVASLRSLTITHTPIVQISDKAFEGLEVAFQKLELSNTACQTVEHRSFSAFNKLKGLSSISLIDTGIVDLPPNAFAVFPELTTLRLEADNLLESFAAGALNNVPPKLINIYLINLQLTEVPKFPPQPGTLIDLSSNHIATLKPGDFNANVHYKSISLRANPISTIENLTLNADHIDFGMTDLPSLDLALIANVTDSSFDSTAKLTHISVSNVELAYKSVNVVVNPALETIDPMVGYVFVRQPHFKININGNNQLNCDVLAWITPYVQCSKQVHLDQSTCSNGQKATDYFNGLGYNCTAMPEQTRLLMLQYDIFTGKGSK